MHFDSIEKVDEYLANIPKFQSEGAGAASFGLERVRRFCRELGNPQHRYPSIHVAGTNGKGSTCRILAAVLKDAGYQTGVFTSPHIQRYNERFVINDREIPDRDLINFFRSYSDQLEACRLSYFEISTAIAFWWFAREGVDVAVVEVGLGGRLDATNILDPAVSIITSVSLDHTDILGDTIEDIAREKGGIIKAEVPVVVGNLPRPAAEVIARIAGEKESPLYFAEHLKPQFAEPGRYHLTYKGQLYNFESSLDMPVQAHNLAVSLQALMAGGFNSVTAEQFSKAVRKVDSGQGRFTKLLATQRWFFDGGHNIEAVRALKDAIRTAGEINDATLVLALMRDKIKPEVMAEFSEFKKIYYYPLDFKRAATFDDIKVWLPKANLFPLDQNRQELIFKDFDSELVIFAGSFYFYTSVQDWIRNCA